MKDITPYLSFDGNCREAMMFYQQCLGGELQVMEFGEHDRKNLPPGAESRVMHAYLASGTLVLMASDSMPGTPVQFGDSVWLNVNCDSAGEVDTLYTMLLEGGSEVMAPHDAFWGARFAMLTDRFGMKWMLNHSSAAAAAA